MESTELQHYGIKGMKWGVRKAKKSSDPDDFGMRDVRQARKAVKKAIKSGKRTNYERVSKEQAKISNKIGYRDPDKSEAAFANARKEIKKAMLLDAGYSEAKAKKGAEWLESRNWNLTFSDYSRYFDFIDDNID